MIKCKYDPCSNKFKPGKHTRLYCSVLCRNRAAYHRFAHVHPDKRTKSKMLQRWYAQRFSASQRGFEFTITDVQLDKLLKSPCFYCSDTSSPITIDRYDNDEGYTYENSVPACKRCNSQKSQIHGAIYEKVKHYLSNGFIICAQDDQGNLIRIDNGDAYGLL